MGFTLYKLKKQECRGRINQILVKREVLDNNQGDIKFFSEAAEALHTVIADEVALRKCRWLLRV